jgi:hypothetical protein
MNTCLQGKKGELVWIFETWGARTRSPPRPTSIAFQLYSALLNQGGSARPTPQEIVEIRQSRIYFEPHGRRSKRKSAVCGINRLPSLSRKLAPIELTGFAMRNTETFIFSRPNFQSGAPKSFATADQIHRARHLERCRTFESRVRNIKPGILRQKRISF